jgi:hypothetical protein
MTDILDTVLSLTALMEEESDRLTKPGLHRDLEECSAAKVRLVGLLDQEMARRNRENPDWLRELEPELRQRLCAAIAALLDTASVNADVISRQIALSAEMISAVAAEVQRLTGTTRATYGADGGMSQTAQATPIALNTRL